MSVLENALDAKIAQMEQEQATVEEINQRRRQFIEEKTGVDLDLSPFSGEKNATGTKE